MKIGENCAKVEKDSDFVDFAGGANVVQVVRLKSGEKKRQEDRNLPFLELVYTLEKSSTQINQSHNTTIQHTHPTRGA